MAKKPKARPSTPSLEQRDYNLEVPIDRPWREHHLYNFGPPDSHEVTVAVNLNIPRDGNFTDAGVKYIAQSQVNRLVLDQGERRPGFSDLQLLGAFALELATNIARYEASLQQGS